MKVFLDTNVVASGLATRGLCSDVVREVLSKHDLVTSFRMLKELRRILVDKFKVDRDYVEDSIALFQVGAYVSNSKKILSIPINDEDDIEILSDALHGESEVFVTGDKEVLSLKSFNEMKILSPRDFWTLITS